MFMCAKEKIIFNFYLAYTSTIVNKYQLLDIFYKYTPHQSKSFIG